VESPKLWPRVVASGIGGAMFLTGSGMTFGLVATVAGIAVAAVPVSIGVVVGLRRRREREAHPLPEDEAREEARRVEATLRLSLITNAAAVPLFAAALFYYSGFELGTALMAGGLVVWFAASVGVRRQPEDPLSGP
jgi:hypothetical protein